MMSQSSSYSPIRKHTHSQINTLKANGSRSHNSPGSPVSSTMSEYGSEATTATGITSAELAFREMSDHRSRFSNHELASSASSEASPVPATTQYYFNDAPPRDATQAVHNMHRALLYLMSNPEELKRAMMEPTPSPGAVYDPMAEWVPFLDCEDDEVNPGNRRPTVPLPYVVFASDAEVVLPQAHTASQLFGLETVRGVELEAAAGVPALCQLFLRWLAVLPGGDHRNLINPPGLTVMKIAGGRYRVTGAHRVVWTWLNEFLPPLPTMDQMLDGEEEDKEHLSQPPVQFNDLVTMTIIDVFETDRDGKLLSYCPTFDNRAVHRTTIAKERLSKGASKLMKKVDIVRKSQAAQEVNKAATFIGKLGLAAAAKSFDFVKKEVEKQKVVGNVQPEKSSKKSSPISATNTMRKANAMNSTDRHSNSSASKAQSSSPPLQRRSEHYISDDETTNATEQ